MLMRTSMGHLHSRGSVSSSHCHAHSAQHQGHGSHCVINTLQI